MRYIARIDHQSAAGAYHGNPAARSALCARHLRSGLGQPVRIGDDGIGRATGPGKRAACMGDDQERRDRSRGGSTFGASTAAPLALG